MLYQRRFTGYIEEILIYELTLFKRCVKHLRGRQNGLQKVSTRHSLLRDILFFVGS